ncbi:MAG: flagellar export protein FliJ [Gallionellales bacterium GWA2_60_18]|nr:MAG: flagellar export protein FliJ [Gallionellales bacterium GWA2_60_18]
MSKPFHLQAVMNLAEHRNEEATRKLGQLNRKQQSAQEKLDMLREYRKDYQAKLQESIRNGMTPAELRNFEQFIGKIDEAISQQIMAVEHSKTSAKNGRDEFDATRRKLQSFDKLQQRHLEAQKKIAAKSEQKTLDEHAGRLGARKMKDNED